VKILNQEISGLLKKSDFFDILDFHKIQRRTVYNALTQKRYNFNKKFIALLID